MFIIVSYDITDDRLRNKLYETLKDYGNSVQYSIFECNLNKNQFFDMKKKTDEFIKSKKDSIRYYIISNPEKIKIFITGNNKNISESSVYII